MNENPIIAEIRRSREEVARSCGYDVRKLMQHYRERERTRPDAEVKLVEIVEPARDQKAWGERISKTDV